VTEPTRLLRTSSNCAGPAASDDCSARAKQAYVRCSSARSQLVHLGTHGGVDQSRRPCLKAVVIRRRSTYARLRVAAPARPSPCTSGARVYELVRSGHGPTGGPSNRSRRTAAATRRPPRRVWRPGRYTPMPASGHAFVLSVYGSARTSQSCGNGPKLNCPAWNRMSGSSSSGPLKNKTSLPTSAASGGPPRTIR
jgi:hypothetical protein